MPPLTQRNRRFGGPDDGRPSTGAGTDYPGDGTGGPTAPGDLSYQEQIDKWKAKIKAGQGNTGKLRDKIRGARVDRWQDRVQAEKNKPIPKDAEYNTDVTAAYGKYTTGLTGLELDRTNVNTDYGYLPEYQQGGVAYNPYSQAAKLQTAYETEKRRSLNEMAAAGQLYSGARQNDFNADQVDYTTADQAARDAWLKEIAGIDAEKAEAGTTLAADVVAAEEAFAERIPEATDPGPLPKYVKAEKKDLKKKLGNLRDAKGDRKEIRGDLKDLRKGKENKKERKQIKSLRGDLKKAPSKKKIAKRIDKTKKAITKLDPYKDVR